MSWQNFVPAVEIKKLLKDRDSHLTLVKHCTREYEGEVKKMGDRVKIFGVGSPTIYTIEKDGTYTANQVGNGSIAGTGKQIIQGGIPRAEDIEDIEVEIQINQMAVWNYGVGDVDAALMGGAKSKMGKLRKRQSVKLAEEQERFIARLMKGFMPSRFKGLEGNRTSSGNATNVFHIGKTFVDTEGAETTTPCNLIDFVVQYLNENNVADSEKLVCECSPKFYRYLKAEYRDLDTNNSKLISGRKFGDYNDIEVCKSNYTIVPDENGVNHEYVFIRTLDSVAFIDPLTKHEAYRPENAFKDAVKGFNLYDGAIVDPKGLAVIEIAY